jgi:hypothetical protein
MSRNGNYASPGLTRPKIPILSTTLVATFHARVVAAALTGALCGLACEPNLTSETAVRQSAVSGGVDVLTQHNDNGRTGFVLEHTLTSASVAGPTFGPKFKRFIDGQIYAQLLVATGVSTPSGTGDLLIAATMKNTVQAFFAAEDGTLDPTLGGAWFTDLAVAANLPPYTDASLDNDFLKGTTTLGIMSTPVIDKAADRIYLVAASGPLGQRTFWVVVLKLSDGSFVTKQQVGLSVSTQFVGQKQTNRAGLLGLPAVSPRWLYVAFASFADSPNFSGWVFSYDLTKFGMANNEGHFCTNCTTNIARVGGGIWQSGSGLVADETGSSIYLMTGNGKAPAGTMTGPMGQPVGQENSFVKLSASNLAVQASWFPPDFNNIDGDNDLDLASGGPVLTPQGIVGGGKTGVFYVFDRALKPRQGVQAFDNDWLMPPANPPTATKDGIPWPILYDNTTSCPTGWRCNRDVPPNIHGNPVTWRLPDDGLQHVYAWSEKSHLKSWALNTDGTFPTVPGSPTKPVSTDASISGQPIVMPGGSLSLSGDPAVAGSGVIWATVPETVASRCTAPSPSWTPCDANKSVVPGELYAFDAKTLNVLYHVPVRKYAKFTPPTIANGHVYVPTFANEILVFGLRTTSYAPSWATLAGDTVAAGGLPAVTSTPSRMDVFIRSGSNNSLEHKFFGSSTWQPAGWDTSPGGVITSNPAAVTSQMCARDLSGGISCRAITAPGAWGPWVSLGGVLRADPAMVQASTGRVDLVAQASDLTLAHNTNVGGAWQGWVTWASAHPQPALNHKLADGARLAIVSRSTGNLDVFARGQDTSLNHFHFDGTNWSWDNLGGLLASDPTATLTASNEIDVFTTGIDNQVAHRYCIGCNGPGDWQAWESDPMWGMVLTPGASPAAVSITPGTIDLFACAADGTLQHMPFNFGSWMWWETLGSDATTGPIVSSTSRGAEVFVRSTSGAVTNVSYPGGVLP